MFNDLFWLFAAIGIFAFGGLLLLRKPASRGNRIEWDQSESD
jgi:hypothetical protein